MLSRLLPPRFHLLRTIPISPGLFIALIMEAVRTSETSVYFNETASQKAVIFSACIQFNQNVGNFERGPRYQKVERRSAVHERALICTRWTLVSSKWSV
jgi:hypothetical protein